ncbi:hypothetical protein MMK25_31845, partial [Bacillus cereus]|nr:hypothetical protein [Bacillus cereus]
MQHHSHLTHITNPLHPIQMTLTHPTKNLPLKYKTPKKQGTNQNDLVHLYKYRVTEPTVML